MLRLQQLHCGYSGLRQPVVTASDMGVSPGSFVCVVGRNGAGKSTLMRTISGIQRSLSGTAALDGRDILSLGASERARQIAVVTTERVSSPGLYARDVVELGRHPFTDWQGHLGDSDIAAVEAAFTRASAAAFAPKLFDALSDGERQRVMIARALAQEPKLMVLDEITAFLDLPGRVEIMSLLRRHAHDTGGIVLISSHDLDLSLELADILWIVDGGVLYHGSPKAQEMAALISTAFDGHDVQFDTVQRKFILNTPDTGVRATGLPPPIVTRPPS